MVSIRLFDLPGRLIRIAVVATCLATIAACGNEVADRAQPAEKGKSVAPAGPASGKIEPEVLRISAEQAREVKVGAVETAAFEARREALGQIDFNQESTVAVFAPYQGRIGRVNVKAGEEVRAGQVLYTVQVPDLAQASATLIATAGQLKVADETFKRARGLAEAQSIPRKELDQNIADQQAADGNYKAAAKVMRLFGLDDRDIRAIEESRRVETEMAVKSPIAGRVTARVAAPGLLVQPGTAPAPIQVSDVRNLWMIANVPESELGAYRIGQAVSVSVQAYPEQRFRASIDYIGDAVDPATHRIVVRARIQDPKRVLRAQMLAAFEIVLAEAARRVAVPQNALVRESDGRFTVWVTEDGTRFKRRFVKPGMTQGGLVEIITGLADGERIARERALFLSNLYLTTDR